MENVVIALFKILLYYAIIYFTYCVARSYEKKSMKIPVYMKIIICFLFIGYLYIATTIPYVMDKKIYALKYSNDIYLSQVYNDSIGLWVITKILHIFSYNPMFLFSVVMFIFMYLTLVSYEKIDDADSFSLLLLLLSEYPFFGFYQIKQCLALGFVSLGFAYYLKKKNFLAFVCFVIGILFHETAVIIFPVLLIMKGSKKKTIRLLEYLLLLITCLFFAKISSFILSIISALFPTLYSNWNIYLNGNYIISNLNFMTTLKGLPFYIMVFIFVIFGIAKKSKVENINMYLILSLFNCFFIILSGYMYWMFRFGSYFYIFNCIIGSLAYKNIVIESNKRIYCFIVLTTFIILGIKLWLQYYLIYGGI